MSKSLKRVSRVLAEAGVEAEILEMPDSTRTAAEAAAAVGCDIDQIAKSIIFRDVDHGKAVLFVTAGGNSVDPEKAGALAGGRLDKADAALIRAQTGFVIGGVAPIGHLSDIRAWFDPRLLDFATVWAAAGTPRHVFAIDPARLLAISGAQKAEFAQDA